METLWATGRAPLWLFNQFPDSSRALGSACDADKGIRTSVRKVAGATDK